MKHFLTLIWKFILFALQLFFLPLLWGKKEYYFFLKYATTEINTISLYFVKIICPAQIIMVQKWCFWAFLKSLPLFFLFFAWRRRIIYVKMGVFIILWEIFLARFEPIWAQNRDWSENGFFELFTRFYHYFSDFCMWRISDVKMWLHWFDTFSTLVTLHTVSCFFFKVSPWWNSVD